MVNIVKFTESAPLNITSLQLSFPAVARIFLGPPENEVPTILRNSPAWAKSFLVREHKACTEQFRSLTYEFETALHPRSGEALRLAYCFVPTNYCVMTLPVFKVFGSGADQFSLVFCGLTSRVTHIVVPRMDLIIYDLDLARSQGVWDAFQSHSPPSMAPMERRLRIGLVDMVSSYAHQAMNHLSGIQRLVDLNVTDFLDEIWVCGTEFFGRTEDIFPELADKVRHITRTAVIRQLSSSDFYVLKLGSNFLNAALHERLAKLKAWRYSPGSGPTSRRPLLAITVRSAGRRCRNLPEIVQQIVGGLLPKYPNLGVVLDGWVFAETQITALSNVITAVNEQNLPRMREEARLCELITSRLPPGVLVANVVGFALLESLRVLREADIYFSHAGTLQHKIAWFTRARGVVHGPKTELGRMESSYFSSEFGTLPIFVDANDIEDFPGEASGDPRNNNYEIKDASGIVRKLDEFLSEQVAWWGGSAAPSQKHAIGAPQSDDQTLLTTTATESTGTVKAQR